MRITGKKRSTNTSSRWLKTGSASGGLTALTVKKRRLSHERVRYCSFLQRMQTEAQQALYVGKYKSDEEFVKELKKAAIFDNIQLSEQQKKQQKSRTLAAVAVAVIVLIAAIIIIWPLLGFNDNDSAMGVLGLRGVSQEELESIEEIHIIGNEVVDYSVFSQYVDGDTSRIEYWNNNDGREVYTTAPGSISDLSGLDKLTNLRVLELEGQQIEDITPLLKLNNLEELSLSCNPISSIDGMENMKNLRRLDISDTNVRELPEGLEVSECLTENVYDSIPDFKGREDVKFYGNDNDIKDVSNLATAKSYDLIEMVADGNETEIIEALKGIPINTFCVAGMQIDSLEELSELDVQVQLNLAYASLTSLDGIEHFEGIKVLDLKYCTGLTDLSPVNKLKSLEQLTLSEDLAYMADQVDDRIEIVYLH